MLSKSPVILIRADPTVFVDQLATLPFARADRATWAYHPNVGRNAFPAPSALRRNLASTKSARILVLELAAAMPSAKLSITTRSASVRLDGQATR